MLPVTPMGSEADVPAVELPDESTAPLKPRLPSGETLAEDSAEPRPGS